MHAYARALMLKQMLKHVLHILHHICCGGKRATKQHTNKKSKTPIIIHYQKNQDSKNSTHDPSPVQIKKNTNKNSAEELNQIKQRTYSGTETRAYVHIYMRMYIWSCTYALSLFLPLFPYPPLSFSLFLVSFPLSILLSTLCSLLSLRPLSLR